MPADLPTLKVEAAFATDPFADSPAWTDISPYVRGFDTSRGRSFELDAVSAGTASIDLRNTDRRFDPLHSASPYFGQLTVNRRVRIGATWDSTDYVLWDGFADSWPQTVIAEGVSKSARVLLPCTDTFKWLAKNKLRPVGAFTVGDSTFGLVGSARVAGQMIFRQDEELPGDRVNSILDLWPFPASMRDIDGGLTLLSKDGTPKTGGRLDPNETALSYCTKVRDSEEGRFHISADGKVTFWARDHWVGTTSQNTSQITLTDDGTGDASYAAIVMDPADDRYVRNVIERTEHWRDTPWRIQSPGSIAMYGPIEDSREVVTRFPADISTQIAWLLEKYKEPKVRISQITIKPRRNPAVLWPQVLGRELGDRITVSRKIADVGTAFSQEYWIEDIEHHATADMEWETVWQLAPVDADVY